MTSMDSLPHVFLVSFPGQGHINPMLRLGKKLAATGLLVTFSTTANAGRRMKNAGSISDDPTPLGNGFLRFEFFDDGLTDTSPAIPFDQYMPQLRRLGEISLLQILKNQTKENRPVACVIGNPFVPWVCDVADHLGISSAVLWVQSLAVLSIYYHHFHGSVPFPSETQPNLDVQLPCLPLLKYDEIPSFLLPNDIYHTIGKTILDQFSNLSNPFCILIDTFEELEAEIVEYMSKIFPIKTVGPLFKNCNEIKTSISGDCLRIDECMEWVDSKPKGSVVYVSFGSVVYLKQEQVDEIAYGLLNSGFCFLWVLKPPASNLEIKRHVLPKEFMEEAGERGKVVQWSPQERVLSHPSVACFMTHCGWNSSVEAISSGVPVLAFPQWGDQLTNAKFLVDVFGVGLRLSRGVGEDRVIKRDEIEKCLREAMVGPKAVEIKQKAVERQMAAEKAVAEGGSSDRNFKHFIDEIRKRSIGCGERFHVTCPSTT
ncbi:gallate 1-beta-glucosyltransferase-like [Cucurbita pepo subsp. pepo]|uniref:gallate 1-beta-glucosyltransferase-like n=1 Tax=Cucurbita pepo subsp. pepo TaxID=3664 RepID=UPI000C9D39CF|nr:gallate 1-beta-glucosyltransferase-like [Cucurbita pepo subsp. pepo]